METTKFVGVVSGEMVWNGFIVIGVINTLADEYKLIDTAKEQFNIDFIKDEYRSYSQYHIYRNATDYRDIVLTIEHTLEL